MLPTPPPLNFAIRRNFKDPPPLAVDSHEGECVVDHHNIPHARTLAAAAVYRMAL